MTTSRSVTKLASEVEDLQRKVRDLSTSTQLAYSSIEDGTLNVRDAEGTVRSSWGVQYDGTVATVYTDGPTPGAPAAPTLVAHQLAVVVQWNGSFEVGDSPLDLAHVQVHVSESVDESGRFEPSMSTLVGTLAPGGGALTFAGDNDLHYVCLVAVSTSGVASPPSDFQSVTPLPADVIIGDELIGKIITGGIIRTAPSGKRVEINAQETNGLGRVSFYDDNGYRASIDAETILNLPGAPTGGIVMRGPRLTTDERRGQVSVDYLQAIMGTRNAAGNGYNSVVRAGYDLSQSNVARVLLQAGDYSLDVNQTKGIVAPLKMQCGVVTISPIANTPTERIITFPVPFKVTPVVVVTPWTSVPGTRVMEASAAAPTTNGFSAWLYRTNTNATSLFWIAMAPDE